MQHLIRVQEEVVDVLAEDERRVRRSRRRRSPRRGGTPRPGRAAPPRARPAARRARRRHRAPERAHAAAQRPRSREAVRELGARGAAVGAEPVEPRGQGTALDAAAPEPLPHRAERPGLCLRVGDAVRLSRRASSRASVVRRRRRPRLAARIRTSAQVATVARAPEAGRGLREGLRSSRDRRRGAGAPVRGRDDRGAARGERRGDQRDERDGARGTARPPPREATAPPGLARLNRTGACFVIW